jgi:O-antigen/teichoic acid export membrane protein
MLSQYPQAIDQIIKTIGIRHASSDASLIHSLSSPMRKYRVCAFTMLCIASFGYSHFAKLSVNAHYLPIFVISFIPSILANDWILTSQDDFGSLGIFRSLTMAVNFITLPVSLLLKLSPVYAIILSNFLGQIAGYIYIFNRQNQIIRFPIDTKNHDNHNSHFSFIDVAGLTIITILNQLYHNFDSLLLGVKSTVDQLANYSAAYRIMFISFSLYYIFTQTLLPHLSRTGTNDLSGANSIAMKSLIFGIFVSLTMISSAPLLVKIFYKNIFNSAAHLLRILSLCIPFEFFNAVYGTAFIAWGYNRLTILIISCVVIFNVVLNWIFIPRFGATGSAWIMLATYILLATVYKATYYKLRDSLSRVSELDISQL